MNSEVAHFQIGTTADLWEEISKSQWLKTVKGDTKDVGSMSFPFRALGVIVY